MDDVDDFGGFRTAAELREETGGGDGNGGENRNGNGGGNAPAFEIPTRPRRRFHRSGGVEYVGETAFVLSPTPARDDGALVELVEGVLASDVYTYGDWFELPLPLYLVHDDDTGDTFRVAVRDGAVELHVLPATDAAGLRALYDRLDAESDCAWTVECRVEPPDHG